MLRPTPLDHHGRAVASIIYKCIENNVAGTQEYLQSRLIQTSQFAQFRKVPESTLKEISAEEPEFAINMTQQPDAISLSS
jgi:hypothetical protein